MIVKVSQCVDCDKTFSKELVKKVRTSSRCDECRVLRERSYKLKRKALDKEKMKIWRLKNIHGISKDHVDELLQRQSHRCLICADDITERYVVDHDHNCCPVPPGGNGNTRRCGNCIRGLLCTQCNSILGYARDDVNILLSAVDYLKGGYYA